MVHADGRRSPRRRWRSSATGACRSTPSPRVGATSSGWQRSGRGASAASCGGATSCRSGTAATRPTSASSRPRATAGSATLTSSTPGSPAALWPFATLGWPEDTPQLRAFYPTDVLLTARDILFLWVARMVMMGLRFADDVPFEHVYVHSVIQAPDGRRMSKSLGTGIDPLEEIDAPRRRRGPLRAAGDVLDPGRALQRREGPPGPGAGQQAVQRRRGSCCSTSAATSRPAPRPQTVEDRWILSRLQRAKADAAQRSGAFDFAKLSLGLYDFVYGELCDWYLELVKGRDFDDATLGDAAPRAARDAGARPSRDPVRDRGDLGAYPRDRRSAGAGAPRRADRRAARRRRRGAGGRADRDRARGARVARGGGRGSRRAAGRPHRRVRRSARGSRRVWRAWSGATPAPTP